MEKKKKVYNRFYDETKWNNVPKFNKDLINDFLLELKASGVLMHMGMLFVGNLILAYIVLLWITMIMLLTT